MNETNGDTHVRTLGERIYEERVKRGWSREDLVEKLLKLHYDAYVEKGSRKLAPSKETVKRWEKDDNVPKPRYRDLLSQAFQISRQEIDSHIVSDFLNSNETEL